MSEKIKTLEAEIAAHEANEKRFSQQRSDVEKAAREQRRMVATKQKELLACYAELNSGTTAETAKKAK